MLPIIYDLSGGVAVLLSGELNGLQNNTLAPALVDYDNTSGWPMAEFQLDMPAASFTSGITVAASLWLLRSVVASGQYENGTSGITPSRVPDVSFPLTSGVTRVVARAQIPPGWFHPLAKNDGTGATWGTSGNVMSMKPFSYQVGSG